jgi:hypothetical protein
MNLRFNGLRLSVLVLLAMAAPLAGANSLRKITLDAVDENSATLTLLLASAPVQKTLHLTHPDRLVIDLAATSVGAGVRIPAGAGPIVALRSGMQAKHTLRLVLELKSAIYSDVRIHKDAAASDPGRWRRGSGAGRACGGAPCACAAGFRA